MIDPDNPPGGAVASETIVVAGHRIFVKRKTRGSGKSKHVTRVIAWCACGWSTPIYSNNEQIETAIRQHVGVV